MYASVALPINLKPLTYRIPNDLKQSISLGSPVFVTLRNKKLTGHICAISKEEKNTLTYEVKEILAIDINGTRLSENFLRFLKWVSEYYHYPMGRLIYFSLTAKKMKKKRIYSLTEKGKNLNVAERNKMYKKRGKHLSLIEHAVERGGVLSSIPKEYRNAFTSLKKSFHMECSEEIRVPSFLKKTNFPDTRKIDQLNKEQESAFQSISKAIYSKKQESFLLHGGTGSGKTEVYLSAIETCLSQGRTVLALIPEISLTPQLFSRFQSRLGTKVALFHSALSRRERADQWSLVHSGEARVVLGTRSCIFLPLDNIGLIVIDEEHETAFKQEDNPRYNARDLALVRAKIENSVVVLSSATPSLESFYQSILGKIKKIELSGKVSGGSKYSIEIIDMKKEKTKTIFSSRLLFHMKRNLEQKKQIILFLNRRGYRSYVLCKSCAKRAECIHCSISLTYYKKNSLLECHYCGHKETMSMACKYCASTELDLGRFGTELVELELKKFFPQARLLRVDRSLIKTSRDLDKKLRQISENKVDIVIGTQMIAKGHDFPHIGLVAILNSDGSLNLPDFRATERSFELFTQVAGRAGRRKDKAIVLLQTYSMYSPAIRYFSQANYDAFAREELSYRLKFRYPPYCKMAAILVTNKSDEIAFKSSQSIKDLIQKISLKIIEKEKDIKLLEVLGPAASIAHKLKGKYRWLILLKSSKASHLNALIKTAMTHWQGFCHKGTSVHVDMDPYSFI